MRPSFYVFDKIISAVESNISRLEDDIEYVLERQEYKYNLNMPGILLDTNADFIKGNSMNWDIEPTEIFITDKTCYAESRVVNIWAFVISAVFILLTVVILIWSAFRNKRM